LVWGVTWIVKGTISFGKEEGERTGSKGRTGRTEEGRTGRRRRRRRRRKNREERKKRGEREEKRREEKEMSLFLINTYPPFDSSILSLVLNSVTQYLGKRKRDWAQQGERNEEVGKGKSNGVKEGREKREKRKGARL